MKFLRALGGSYRTRGCNQHSAKGGGGIGLRLGYVGKKDLAFFGGVIAIMENQMDNRMDN